MRMSEFVLRACVQQESATGGAKGKELLENQLQPTGDYWGSFLTMMFALALVIGMIVLVAWLLKFFFGRRLALGGGSLLQLVASVPLGERRFISVLRVGERYYLVGISSAEISLLSTLDPDDVKTWLEGDKQDAGESGFARLLRRLRGEGGESGGR